jgi:hypothetical protein
LVYGKNKHNNIIFARNSILASPFIFILQVLKCATADECEHNDPRYDPNASPCSTNQQQQQTDIQKYIKIYSIERCESIDK